MRRTGWEEMFGKARRDILVCLLQLPDASGLARQLGIHDGITFYSSATNECRLAAILTALDRLFSQYGETMRCTDVCLRRWLRGRFLDRLYKRPFQLLSRLESEWVYRKEMKHCLCFWLRVLQLPPRVARAIMARPLRKTQREALDRLWLDPIWIEEGKASSPPAARYSSYDPGHEGDEGEFDDNADDEGADDEGADDESVSDWSSEEEADSYDEEGSDDFGDFDTASGLSANAARTRRGDAAVDAVLGLCYFMITEDFADGTASLIMLVFSSGLRGLS
jgi:hypothetical protein